MVCLPQADASLDDRVEWRRTLITALIAGGTRHSKVTIGT
jgi:hypothetical protein